MRVIYLNSPYSLDLFLSNIFKLSDGDTLFFLPDYLEEAVRANIKRRLDYSGLTYVFLDRKKLSDGNRDISKCIPCEISVDDVSDAVFPLGNNFDLEILVDFFKESKIHAYEEGLLSYKESIFEKWVKIDFVYGSNYLDIFRFPTPEAVSKQYSFIEINPASFEYQDRLFIDPLAPRFSRETVVLMDPFYYAVNALEEEVELLILHLFMLLVGNSKRRDVFIKWHPRRSSKSKNALGVSLGDSISGAVSFDQLCKVNSEQIILAGFVSSSLFHAYHHYKIPVVHITYDFVTRNRCNKRPNLADEIKKEILVASEVFLDMEVLLDSCLDRKDLVNLAEEKYLAAKALFNSSES